jgi:hypothetical protein
MKIINKVKDYLAAVTIEDAIMLLAIIVFSVAPICVVAAMVLNKIFS